MPEEFNISEDFTSEFNAYPEGLRKPVSTSIIEMAAAMNAARMGTDVSFARNEIERLGTAFLDVNARAEAEAAVLNDFRREADQAIEVQSIPDLTAADKKRSKASKFVQETDSPETYSLARNQGGSLFDHEMAKAAARYTTLQKIIDEEIAAEEVSISSVLFDIADLLVSAPIDALRLGGFERTEIAERIRSLLTADISEEQFELEVRSALNDARDAGILTDSNFLFLLSQAQNLEELGEGIEGTLEQIGTTADLLTLGGFAASKALRGLSVARNTTGLVSALAGPKKATEVLSEALRQPGTNFATNAGVARETLPSFARHPESMGTEYSWTSPGSHLAPEIEKENTFLNIARSLVYSRRIDPEILAEHTPRALKKLSEEIDADSHNRVINMSIDVDDQDNLFGTITYGRADGLPFGAGRANASNAKASAQKLANRLNNVQRQVTELPNDLAEASVKLAQDQRGLPEQAMVDVQFAMGGGILNPVVERAGDTLHRLFQFANRGEFTRSDALEKINTVRRNLNSEFGFEREFRQNLRNNAEARGISIEKMQERIDNALRIYTNAYKELKKDAVIPLQKLIIDGNIAIGEQRWEDARKIWDEIHSIVSDKEKFNKAVAKLTETKKETKVTGGTGEAKVRPIERGGRTLYVVDVQRNFPTEGLTRELTNSEIGTHFLRAFGGTFLTIPKRLDALAKRGEGVFSQGVRRMSLVYKNALKGVDKESRRIIEQIFYDMRDGDRLSHMRRPLTLAEFRSEWARYSDVPPSRAAENLYLKTQELNDALYFLKADDIFKRVNNEGFTKVVKFRLARRDGTVDDFSLPAKRIAKEDVDDVVLNPITGETWAPDEIPDGKQIFRPMGGYKYGDAHAKYLAFDKPEVRRLYHSDVLGYNPGGPRQYDFLNHTVKQETRVKLLSGREVSGRPRTIMGTATRQEAEFAANEINGLFASARELIPNLRKLSQADAISAIEDLGPAFDDTVALNNTWNTSIETAQGFADFLRRNEIDPRQNVGIAAMDDELAIADDAGQFAFPFKGMTNRDLFDFNTNAPRNGPRRDKPLTGFGGVQAETRSPLDTIQNDFLRTMHARAFGAYNFQAVSGWLKGARPYIKNSEELVGLDPLRAMNKADVSDVSKEGRNYIAARDAINRTLGKDESMFERMWNHKMDQIAEWVYDKGKKKTAIWLMRNSKNPLEYLRGWSFDARLGMLSPDQLIVQSSQAVNILAIIGPRRIPEWLQATATHWPVRLAQEAIDRHGFEGAREIIKSIGRRTAAFTGMSEEEFVDFARWVGESGRLQVGGEVAEISAVSPVLARGMFSKLRQAARVFFNEGEKFPRSVALRVAWNEYKKKFPKADMFSDHAINWITSRQDALTAAMTRASAARWQKGPLSIPFQFLSYITRMMESLFSDRLLTRRERGKLFVAQMLFWGTAGVGAGKALDAYILENGLEIDESEYTMLRYGLLDSLIQATFDTQSAIGGRLAPAEGIQTLLENWSDSNFGEIVGGPSYTFIRDTGQALWTGGIEALTGRTGMVEADLKKALRNISSANRLYQAWFIHQLGTYYSRNDDPIVSGLTNSDAFLTILGFTPEDVSLTYSMVDLLKSQNDNLKEHTNRVRELVREHNRAIQDNDLEKARELQRMIGIYINATPIWAQPELRRVLAPEIGTMMDRLAGVVLERGYGTVEREMGRMKEGAQ